MEKEKDMKLKLETSYQIIEWAYEFPHVEVCGFVKRMPDGCEVVVPMINTSSSPATDFRWSVEEMQKQWGQMDEEGSEPIAYYHSHPGGKEDPSETDMRAALQVGSAYLIAYPEISEIVVGDGTVLGSTRQWQLTAWMCIEAGILVQEPLEFGS